MTDYLVLTPRDPIIARDGRPFGAAGEARGNRMRSVDWPYPSVLAGSLRTLLGKRAGSGFDQGTVDRLKQLAVAGPLPMTDEGLYLPRPSDIVVREEDRRRQGFAARPARPGAGEGCDLPHEGLQPALLPDQSGEDFKPARVPAFWSRERMAGWLADPLGDRFAVPQPDDGRRGADWGDGFLDAPDKDERTHVRIAADSGAAKEGDLFVTVGLDLSGPRPGGPLQMAARVASTNGFAEALNGLDDLHPLGGERRLVRWESRDPEQSACLWECPGAVGTALRGSPLVRMVLATPALFRGGWKPGWLGGGPEGLEGSPPGAGVRLRLVGAVVERWKAISGWSLEQGRRGPKPVRRLVPAGSVYFFEVVGGDPATLEGCWLQSVSDFEEDQQDCRDGFGLALWGVWGLHP
jgi:CRISPR-associated protein Cmr3